MRFLLLSTFILTLMFLQGNSGSAADSKPTAAKRRAMAAGKPFSTAVPRSSEPSGELDVLRIWPDPIPMRIAVAALQGIVNRDKPRLYIGIDKPLRWLEYYSGKTITVIEPDIFQVFAKYKDQVKGIVVYDGSVDALANVAITYAGIEDLIPADPEYAKTLSEKFGWKVVHDLRGKWSNRLEAYTWAYENLFPRCTKFALTHYNHGYNLNEPDPFGMDSETQKTGFAVDYAVEFRTFTWHVPKEPSKEEVELAEKIFESVPFHTPIFGRSATQGCFPEPAFVSWVAKFANLHIPSGMSNTSVLSGAQLPPELLKQKQLPPARDMGPDKVYVAFTNSEKDNLEHVIGGGPPWHRLGMETDDPYKIWWNDPWRGRVAVGWPIGPLVADLAPTTMAHFTTTATDNDYFLAALSGLCLSDPDSYGSAYPDMQDELLDEYCKMTGEYMKKLGWTQVQPVGGPAVLRHFVKNIPGLTGIMEGYGPHKGMTLEKADYVLDGVPVFHALTDGTTGTSRNKTISEVNRIKAKGLSDAIKAVKIDKKPAFIHSWVVGWDFGPTSLKMAADLLPEDYVIVRPDELASLYNKYHGKASAGSTKPGITAAGTVTETAKGSDGLVIDTGKMKVEIGWGSSTQPVIKRVMGVDGKWRCNGMAVLHNPRDLSVSKFTSKKTRDTSGEKEYLLSYTFSDGSSRICTIRAIAGHPYVLVTETAKGVNLPSWGFDPCTDFLPDTLQTDATTQTLDYKQNKPMGSMPWYRWVMASRQNGPERDMIGVVTVSWPDWTNGEALFWQRPPGGYLEFYHGRTGTKKFAITALDKNDPEAPKRVWGELNGE